MPLAEYALCTVEDVNSEFDSMSPGDYADRIEPLIHDVSSAMAEEADREFFYEAGRQDFLASAGGPILLLPKRPVVTIVRIEVVAVDGAVEELIDPATYRLDCPKSGKVYRSQGWPTTQAEYTAPFGASIGGTHHREIRVTYDCGWVTPAQATAQLPETLPSSLRSACKAAVVGRYHSRGKQTGLKSEAYGPTKRAYYSPKEGVGRILSADALEAARKFRVYS